MEKKNDNFFWLTGYDWASLGIPRKCPFTSSPFIYFMKDMIILKKNKG